MEKEALIENRVKAFQEDMKKLMEIVKMPKKQALREAEKLWMQVRWREVEFDYNNEFEDVLHEDYYKHCCKTCKHRIKYIKEYRSFAFCLVIRNAKNNCGLVKQWIETRKEKE